MSWVASGLPNLITNYFIPAVCLDVCVSACACRVYVMRCQTARLLDAFSPLLIWAHLNKFKARGIFIQVFFDKFWLRFIFVIFLLLNYFFWNKKLVQCMSQTKKHRRRTSKLTIWSRTKQNTRKLLQMQASLNMIELFQETKRDKGAKKHLSTILMFDVWGEGPTVQTKQQGCCRP